MLIRNANLEINDGDGDEINNDDEIELYYTCVDENNEQKQCSARSARSINNNNAFTHLVRQNARNFSNRRCFTYTWAT